MKLSSKGKIGSFAAIVLSSVGSASAAVPTEATDALTGIQTDAGTLATAAWPVLAAITGTFILMKLVKRFLRSAS